MVGELRTDGRPSLEEEFFARINKELIEDFREKKSRDDARQELTNLSGIQDEETLNHLLDQGINPSTMASLMLAPLVLVAWADGDVDAKEREAILRAVSEKGLDPFHPAYKLLDSWLNITPDQKLFTTWKTYIQSLSETMDRPSFLALKKEILGRAKEVAEAAGGFLGFGRKISGAEKEELERLEEAFQAHH